MRSKRPAASLPEPVRCAIIGSNRAAEGAVKIDTRSTGRVAWLPQQAAIDRSFPLRVYRLDRIFVSKTDLVAWKKAVALINRLRHMNFAGLVERHLPAQQ